MRRVFLVLLALLLPLKAIGAAVVPITGAPHHQHQDRHQHGPGPSHDGASAAAYPELHASAHSGCEGMAETVAADSPVHDHACPHLAMVTVVPLLRIPGIDGHVPEVATEAAPRFNSIVLQIAVPPPTYRS